MNDTVLDPDEVYAQALQVLDRTIGIVNGKGGVFKTSITANVGGECAKTGMKVLVIDIDVSGALKVVLGLSGDERDDQGKGILEAIWSDADLPIVRDVRPGLDFVFGGRNLEMLSSLVGSPTEDDLPAGSVPREFARKVAQVAEDYDLILIDCPPGDGKLQDLALAAARYVLIPTKTDQLSWEGLRGIGPRVKKARKSNPDLTYLGVVVTGHTRGASRVYRNTKAKLDEIGDTVPLLDTSISHSESLAQASSVGGKLASELAAEAVDSRRLRLQALSQRRRATDESSEKSSNVVQLPNVAVGERPAASIAQEYVDLATELCQLIEQHEQSADDTPAGGAR